MKPRLIKLLLRHRTAVTGAATLGIATAAYLAAFALRFDLAIPPPSVLRTALRTLPLLLACKLVGFATSGLFNGWWRHVSVRDAAEILRGNLVASALFLTVMVFGYGLDGFPRAVFLVDLLLCTTAMTGARLAIRMGREHASRPAVRRIDTLVLIAGAGAAGIQLREEIESRRRLRFGVVGFVDDDPGKLGRRICGTPVLGTIDNIPRLVAEHDVSEVLIALPSAPGALIRRIVGHCEAARVRHRVLPSLGELVEGRVMYTQMREVQVDDLLARAPATFDLPRVRELIAGKAVLVTGAAGSIGSELCRQLAAYGPERLVLYDRHENGLVELGMELRERFPEVALESILGDVLLPDQLRHVFALHRPEIVFHAAAYKHLPMAELNMLEGVRNNILGTRNVAEAALAHGVREFILVSTDKAVRPTSVLGVTKRVAEMVVQGLQNGCGAFMAVRFGNVLGSSGSVVPLFRNQIAHGGPVTVTHPDVTRYFMTIPEAVQLILQAAAIGHGGEILILDMGEPVRIVDLARQMIRLSGFEPDEDITIVFTGLRPGEKLNEDLVDDEDEIVATRHDRIKIVRRPGRPMCSDTWLGELQACVEAGDAAGALRMLQTVVPAYRPSDLLLAATHAEDAAEQPDAVATDQFAEDAGALGESLC